MDNSIIIVVTEILHIKEPTRAELVERLSKHPPESKKALDLTRRIERLDLTNWKLKHLKKD